MDVFVDMHPHGGIEIGGAGGGGGAALGVLSPPFVTVTVLDVGVDRRRRRRGGPPRRTDDDPLGPLVLDSDASGRPTPSRVDKRQLTVVGTGQHRDAARGRTDEEGEGEETSAAFEEEVVDCHDIILIDDASLSSESEFRVRVRRPRQPACLKRTCNV